MDELSTHAKVVEDHTKYLQSDQGRDLRDAEEPKFQAGVREAYPDVDFDKPFSEFTAARSTLQNRLQDFAAIDTQHRRAWRCCVLGWSSEQRAMERGKEHRCKPERPNC